MEKMRDLTPLEAAKLNFYTLIWDFKYNYHFLKNGRATVAPGDLPLTGVDNILLPTIIVNTT